MFESELVLNGIVTQKLEFERYALSRQIVALSFPME